MPMGGEIQEREQDREGLLHPQNPAEGPFAVELNDRSEHRGVTRDSFVGNDMLTSIVAFSWASP